jgi:hypothetical protein
MIMALVWALLVSLPAFARGRGPYSPPPQCEKIQVGEDYYVKSEVYLACHADTALLTDYGFRDFEFQGWVMSRIRYAALCPLSWDGASLPSVISGISYETPDRPFAYVPSDGEYSAADQNTYGYTLDSRSLSYSGGSEIRMPSIPCGTRRG